MNARLGTTSRGRARSASSIALAAFAVHQLRYLLAPGAASEDLLGRLGHGPSGPLAPLLLGCAVAAFVAALTRRTVAEVPPARGRGVSALVLAVGVLAVFCCQESIEGVSVAGHVDGITSILSSGGWAALPTAALFGLLAALVDRGMEAVERRLAAPPASFSSSGPARSTVRPAPLLGRGPAPLASGLARRPPPAPS